MAQGVVPVVVGRTAPRQAAGAAARCRCRRTRLGEQGQRTAGVAHPPELAPCSREASTSSGIPSGSGAMADRIRAGGPADEDRQRQGFIPVARRRGSGTRPPSGSASAPESARVVTLNAVDAEVVLAAVRVLAVDQRQGDEVAAVLGPGLDQRQAPQVGGGLPALEDRAAADGAQAEAHRFPRQPAVAPELARRQRGELVGHLDQLFQEALRPRPERQVDPAGGAEQVGDRGEVRPFDALEQQRRSPAAMTRRWISASSRSESTGASTRASSPSFSSSRIKYPRLFTCAVHRSNTRQIPCLPAIAPARRTGFAP